MTTTTDTGATTMTDTERTNPEVGDILRSCWGYDQTNVDYYEVVGITPSGKSVKIRPIGYATNEANGFMAALVTPAPGEFTGPAMTKRHRPNWREDGYLVKITSYANAHGPHAPTAETRQTSYA